MRHALGHGPARRVGTLAPLLIRDRPDQVVNPCLRAAILVGDELELRMHVSTSPPLPPLPPFAALCRPASSSPFPASVAIPLSREHSPAFSPMRARTPPPRPAPGLSSRRSEPGSRGGTAALRSAARPSPASATESRRPPAPAR